MRAWVWDLGFRAWGSSFLPLAFAIADKEIESAYTCLSRAVLKAAHTLGHELLPSHILQWHGDQHLGIEAARQEVVPGAARLSDWAHVMGMTSKGPAGIPGILLAQTSPISGRSFSSGSA